MGKVAYMFSGQGDQFAGMGADIANRYVSAQRIFEMCDRLRPGTSDQCFHGTQELKETMNTQPCLFAMELASAAVLLEKGIVSDMVAGFSLGEMTAATVSGLFDYETGFRLVCKRGELMQQETLKHDTSMAAVVKLNSQEVEALCEEFPDIYPVNYNCPGQISVSGLSEQMSTFYARVREAGGRAIPLKVKGAFHSPFMNDAANAFAQELKKVEFGKVKYPLYSNLTAQVYSGDAAELLSRQICCPVRWEQLIRNMIASGVDTFIEIGPGKTLCNMIEKIDADVHVWNVAEYLRELEA